MPRATEPVQQPIAVTIQRNPGGRGVDFLCLLVANREAIVSDPQAHLFHLA